MLVTLWLNIPRRGPHVAIDLFLEKASGEQIIAARLAMRVEVAFPDVSGAGKKMTPGEVVGEDMIKEMDSFYSTRKTPSSLPSNI